ncbi:hypothetical protein M8013_06080 [Enterobacteriaceae bacterium H4N4]|uniref:Uncharacterized protein n=1 Tax=Silvania confinis TaxID=2926470 RepID=A0A9J6QDK4_9ENTR|nr:hypothetical protein [Silvania confinis]MCU6668323.1 hypothetical protein [Silvania confinis]
MALPWLIGAAVLGVGALIAAASSDDDSSNGNGDDEERKRRERAERERREREQQEERKSIKAALKSEGARRAADFTQTLSGWVEVNYQSPAPFKAAILQTGKQYKRVVAEHFVDKEELSMLDSKTRQNLNEFEACYDVTLTMTDAFEDVADEMTEWDVQLQELQDYREQFERIRQHLAR